jgi:hypothetical protein
MVRSEGTIIGATVGKLDVVVTGTGFVHPLWPLKARIARFDVCGPFKKHSNAVYVRENSNPS